MTNLWLLVLIVYAGIVTLLLMVVLVWSTSQLHAMANERLDAKLEAEVERFRAEKAQLSKSVVWMPVDKYTAQQAELVTLRARVSEFRSDLGVPSEREM